MAHNLTQLSDGLTNALTGIGTRADPRSASRYRYITLDQNTIEAAYRGSGMMRKCIDVPALDMVRAWRTWKADDVDIEKIEAEEKRLGLRQKIYEAEILRGLGGGAIIIGAPGDPSQPLGDIGIGQLAYLHVVSRYQITLGDQDQDPLSSNYGKPQWYTINNKSNIRIDPSRIVCFTGEVLPSLSSQTWDEQFWGESRVARLLNAVQNSDTAQDAFAALLHKARVTRVGIPDLLNTVGSADGEAAFSKRLAAVALGESIHNMTIYDSGNGGNNPGETITDYQVAWAGMESVMQAYDMRVCAIAYIPATRLLGKAPDGLNSSGEGQQQDWHKHVRAMQVLQLSPCIDILDKPLLQSAVGKVDKSIWYEWAPLDVPDKKTVAETNKMNIESAVRAQETGAIPEAAFAEGFQSLLVETGIMPALETALERIPEVERYEMEPDADPNGPDPNALTGGEVLEAQ